MRRASWLFAAVLATCLGVLTADAQTGPGFRVSAHISAATTTTLQAAVAGQKISIQGGSVCVDAGGVTTGITLQDGAGTNLVGTGVVYALGAGQCLTLPLRPDLWYTLTAVGQSLQLVTGAAGPVEVYLEILQR
jgi:hypothetical protein